MAESTLYINKKGQAQKINIEIDRRIVQNGRGRTQPCHDLPAEGKPEPAQQQAHGQGM